MNKQIQELAKQAGFTVVRGQGLKETVPEDVFVANVCVSKEMKKFAELIVKMCADYADMAQDAGCEYAGDYVAEAMGYGVEEGITEWRNKG